MQYIAYKKSGRTKKKKHKTHKRGYGRPKKAVTITKAKPMVKATMKPDEKRVANKTRLEIGANRERLADDISDWDNKSDTALDANGDLTLNWRQVATINRISDMTFYHYIHIDLKKRHLLGSTVGRQRLMVIEDINIVG